MDSKNKQKKDLKETKNPDAEKETIGVELTDDLKKLLSEYREITGETPGLHVLKDIKRVDKSKDVVDKSRDVTLTVDSLIEVSAPDKSRREITAAILTTALLLNQNAGIADIAAAFKNVKDTLEKAEMKKD